MSRLEQAAPLTESLQWNFARRRQCLDAEVGPARVLEDAEGIARLAEEAAPFAGERPAVHVEQPDVRRQGMTVAAQTRHR